MRKTLTYNGSNNTIFSFETKILPIRFFSSFNIDELAIICDAADLSNAIVKEYNSSQELISVKIRWPNYVATRQSANYNLSVYYKKKLVPDLNCQLTISYPQRTPLIRAEINPDSIIWDEMMYSKLMIRSDFNPNESWKFKATPIKVSIPENQNLRANNGINNFAIDPSNETSIALKYYHTCIRNIDTTQNENFTIVIDGKIHTIPFRLLPSKTPTDYEYSIEKIRNSYIIGGGGLDNCDLWKVNLKKCNPYASDLNDIKVKIDNELLSARQLDNYSHQWCIYIANQNLIRKLPDHDIEVNVTISPAGGIQKSFKLFLTRDMSLNSRRIQIIQAQLLRIEMSPRSKGYVAFSDAKYIPMQFRICNTSNTVKLQNIKINYKNETTNIDDSLDPLTNVIYEFMLPNPNKTGEYSESFQFSADYGGSVNVPFTWIVAEKQNCSLEVNILDRTVQEIYADEKYEHERVCSVLLRAIPCQKYGERGSNAIKIPDIHIDAPFSLHCAKEMIEPGSAERAEIFLDGSIESPEHDPLTTEFFKQITFTYNGN